MSFSTLINRYQKKKYIKKIIKVLNKLRKYKVIVLKNNNTDITELNIPKFLYFHVCLFQFLLL